MVQKKKTQWTSRINQSNDYPPNMFQKIISPLYKPLHIGCFTIALGKKTGTTFPITFNNKTKLQHII